MINITEEKKRFRTLIKEEKLKRDAQWREIHSRPVLNNIIRLEEFEDAETILIYHSLWDEVQTPPFIDKFKKDKQIVLPVVKGPELELRLFAPEKMHKGSFDIMEPEDSCLISPQDIDLAIIPGVAFDINANRLGRGKGFYDRLLSQVKAPKFGICFDYQLFQEIPHTELDIPLDGIITENRIIRIDGNNQK